MNRHNEPLPNAQPQRHEPSKRSREHQTNDSLLVPSLRLSRQRGNLRATVSHVAIVRAGTQPSVAIARHGAKPPTGAPRDWPQNEPLPRNWGINMMLCRWSRRTCQVAGFVDADVAPGLGSRSKPSERRTAHRRLPCRRRRISEDQRFKGSRSGGGAPTCSLAFNASFLCARRCKSVRMRVSNWPRPRFASRVASSTAILGAIIMQELLLLTLSEASSLPPICRHRVNGRCLMEG